MVYAIIHQHLGDELFLKCYREYIKRWAKKSPTPYDFFYTFENVSGQDLGWLWKPWFFEFGLTDVAIQSFEQNKLIVMNQGNRPIPLIVEIKYKNGESKFISQGADIWTDGKNEVQVIIPDNENVERISLNTMVADVNLIDNFFPPIWRLYENIEISAEILGQYRIEELSDIISITMEEGLMYFKRAYDGISKVIYPKDSVNFCSIDGSMNLKFNMDDSGFCTGVDINWNRIIHGKKLE